MSAWCDPRKDDCRHRNLWGNYDLTDNESQPISYYPAWYKAVADAVVSVDPQLTVGGPASSDCWGNSLDGAKCYGGHLRPTADDLLSTVGQNWALGIVEFGAKHDVRVDFSSSHSYSSPCGNATSLHEEFKQFADAIHRSSRPSTSVIVTEWSADPIPDGVGCADVYSPGRPVIANYHDTEAQATFATKAIWLIDGDVPLLSHWAFSDIFEEQGFTGDVFNGGFGLLNRWGVRKPVFNAFKLLQDAGAERWNVSGIQLQPGGGGVVAFASKAADGSVHVIVANHEVGACNVTIRVLNPHRLLRTNGDLSVGATGTVTRIDSHHANAYTAWLEMGSPKADSNGTLDPKVVAALHKAAALVEEPLAIHTQGHSESSGETGPTVAVHEENDERGSLGSVVTPVALIVTVEVPHHGIARVRLAPTMPGPKGG
jgi:beta-xylosidase